MSSNRPMELAESDQPEAIFARFSVEVLEGDDVVGKRVVSEGPELQIGTAASNEMVLTDSTVSRHHCSIVVTPDGFRINDLDSMNGVKLGGFLVHEAFLKDRCTLKLGRVKLGFTRVDGVIREKLSTTKQFGAMVGDSVAMRRLFARCRRVASTPRPITITGEAGTGKRTLAQAIHGESQRASLPFVTVDLDALPRAEIEPTVFGPTGAFARAGEGTVHITNIAVLPPELQEVLVETFGSYAARLIASNPRDLRPLVNRGRFRADLYHRLAGVRIDIPPLRDRTADVPRLARQLYTAMFPDQAPANNELIQYLSRRVWWGNAIALRAAIEREGGRTTDT